MPNTSTLGERKGLGMKKSPIDQLGQEDACALKLTASASANLRQGATRLSIPTVLQRVISSRCSVLQLGYPHGLFTGRGKRAPGQPVPREPQPR